MFVLNGVKINIDTELTIDGTQFPRGYFYDKAARDSWGITEVADPELPNPEFYTWYPNSDGTLVISPRPVDSIKAALIAKCKDIRNTKVTTGGYKISVEGVDKWFHSDTLSRGQQQGLITKANMNLAAGGNLEDPIEGVKPWRTMDGSYVTITNGIALDILQAATNSDSAFFEACVVHELAITRTQGIDDLTTIRLLEEYAANHISQDWPAVFVA